MQKLYQHLFPFRRGNISKLALIYFFTNLYFYIPVATLYLQDKGLTLWQINSLWGVIVFTQLLTEVPTGLMADRLGRKQAILLALFLQFVGEVIFFYGSSYPMFALAAIAGGIGFAFSSGCVEALIYDSLKLEQKEAAMTEAMGYISAGQRLANLLAFSLGGLLVSQLSQAQFSLAIALTALMVFTGFLLAWSLEEPHESQETEQDSSLHLLRDGLKLFAQHKVFRQLVLLSLFTIPFADYLMNLYQPYFVAFSVSPVWLGLSLAIASGLSILGARYAYLIEKQLGLTQALLLVTLLPGLLYMLFALLANATGLVLIFCLLFASMSFKDPLFSGLLNQHIESKNRATVLSLISMASGLYVAFMGLVIGIVADSSLANSFSLMGLIIILAALLLRVKSTRIDQVK